MASRLKEDITVNKNNETEELLVFGYSCKLFRDDEKALYIDQGKHLIPWMGDESLKIDRYDARGTLFDLKQAEAPSGGFDKYFGLTDMEKQIESMCDEERYRALITNEEEETMYQEEELKRLHYAISDKGNSYGQVEYKYDGEENDVEENNAEKTVQKSDDAGDDEPFVPSPQLDLPVNMVLPETVKHNAIIEKTAMFINNQGPQMEILLKMKQAGNPQFNFLSFDNPLHSYYRHLLMAIKGGHYKPDLPESATNQKADVENEEDDHYLHPSLASSVSKVELAPSIPSINYKPSAHCTYSMLVNKIKDKKCSEQGTHLFKLKEALERLKEEKRNNENEFSLEKYQCSNAQSLLMPPNDMQIIIDKMASYVAKNGRDFEAVVQMKNDPRFDFLNSSHPYNGYYQFKVKQYDGLEKSSKSSEGKLKFENPNAKSRDESKGKLAPVCFSIKKPKDSEPVIEKSALPVEESSDEEGKEAKEKKEKEGGEEKREKEGKEEIVTIDLAAQEEKEEKNKKILAAERLKDKLTAAAREKVAMATKERQLQLERKRRAAAFLRTIHPDPGPKGGPVYGPQLPGVRDGEEGSDVASLPDATTEEMAEEEDDEEEKMGGRRKDSVKRRRRRRNSRREEEEEKRRRSSDSGVRHKHREKQTRSLKSERQDRVVAQEEEEEESKSQKELNERISESSSLSAEDEERKRRPPVVGKSRSRSEDSRWKRKTDRDGRNSRREGARHGRKKHKKDDGRERNSRKHSKLKRRQKRRSGEGEDQRNSRSKRSRKNSSAASGGGSSSSGGGGGGGSSRSEDEDQNC